jgi:hypothetical protein
MKIDMVQDLKQSPALLIPHLLDDVDYPSILPHLLDDVDYPSIIPHLLNDVDYPSLLLPHLVDNDNVTIDERTRKPSILDRFMGKLGWERRRDV